MHTLSLAFLALFITFVYGDLITPGVRLVDQRLKRQNEPHLFLPNHREMMPTTNGGMSRPVFEPFVPSIDPAAEGTDGALELPEDLDLNAMDLNSLTLVNDIDNITAFAELFGITLPQDNTPSSRMDFRGVSRSGNVRGTTNQLAKKAKCKPELRTVELDLPVEQNTLFYPTCVRLERCGGCCYGPLITCRPTVTEVVSLKVMKIADRSSSSSSNSRNTGTVERSANDRRRQRGRGRRRRRQSVPSFYEVEAVKHVACDCGCKVQEQDCNSAIHNYMEGECACVCKRRDEQQKCEEQKSIKYWDSDSCGCYCRRNLDCATEEYFSQESCRCERAVARGAFPLDIEVNMSRGLLRRPNHNRRRPQRIPLRGSP